MNATTTAKEAEKPPLDDENVFVLHAVPSATATRKLLGSSRAKAVTELRLARLSERTRVACCYVNGDGAHVLGTAVPVGQHWVRDGDDGNVNSRSFVRALAKSALPFHVKFRRDHEDDLGTLRLAEC